MLLPGVPEMVRILLHKRKKKEKEKSCKGYMMPSMNLSSMNWDLGRKNMCWWGKAILVLRCHRDSCA